MNTNQIPTEYFSISTGGPFYNSLVKLRLHNKPVKLIIVFLFLTWFPLLVLSLFQGTAYSDMHMPFLKDVPVQMRLLLSLPMFLIIGFVIDKKVIDLQKYFSNTLMSDKEQQSILKRRLSNAKKLACSTLAEIFMVLLIVAIIRFNRGGMFSGIHEGGSWMIAIKHGSQQLSFAGYWFVYISIPVYQFLFLRWQWRYIVWLWLLLSLSRERLNLQCTHSDQFGGLSIILYAQKSFSLLFVISSIVVSGEMIQKLLENPATFDLIREEVLGFIALILIIILIPFLFFTAILLKTKDQGILSLNGLGASLSNKFENEWIGDKPIEKKVTETIVSTSTLQDYSTIYQSMVNLHIIPIKPKDVVFFAVILFVPYIPLMFIHFSMGELFQKLIGLLM